MSTPGVFLLAPAAACLLSWLGLGVAIPRRFLSGDPLLDWMTRIGAGSAVLSLVLFGLGRIGAFRHWLIVGITLGLAAIGALFAIRELRRPRLPRLPTVVWILLALCAAAFVLDLVASTAPPTSPDALRYHVGLPKQWLATGWIRDDFWRFESFNPLGIQVLFAQGLALGGGGAAGAVGAVLAVLAAVAVFGLARELGAGSIPAASVAVALFTLEGMLTWLATSSFPEPGLTLYSILAVWQAVRFARTRESVPLAAAGFFSGAAAGTKYLGLASAALVLVPLAVIALREHRARALAASLGLAAVVALPWYIRNAIEAGNPIYPLVFGGRFVTPRTESTLREGLGAAKLPHPVLRLPILPLDLLRYPNAFAKGRYIGTMIFLAAPLALLAPRRWRNLVLFAGAVVFIAICLATVPSQARFFLPALGVLSALGGVGVVWLLETRPWTRTPLVAVAAVVAVVWLVPSAALTRHLLPVAFGFQSRSAFLQETTGVEDVFDASATRASGTVGFADYTNIFNFPGTAIALDSPEFNSNLTRQQLLERLRAHRVTDVLTPELDLESPSPLPEGRFERLDNLAHVLRPIDHCLDHLASYEANVVTSRSTGSTKKTRFGLLTAAPCYPSRTLPTEARSSTSSTASPSSRYSSSVLTDHTS